MVEVSIYIKDHYVENMDAEYYEGPASIHINTGREYRIRKGEYVHVDWKTQSVKIITDDKAVIFKADAIRIENSLE